MAEHFEKLTEFNRVHHICVVLLGDIDELGGVDAGEVEVELFAHILALRELCGHKGEVTGLDGVANALMSYIRTAVICHGVLALHAPVEHIVKIFLGALSGVLLGRHLCGNGHLVHNSTSFRFFNTLSVFVY